MTAEQPHGCGAATWLRSSLWPRRRRPQRRKFLWLITPSVCILVHILATHPAPISGLMLAKITRKHNSILKLRTKWGWVVRKCRRPLGVPFLDTITGVHPPPLRYPATPTFGMVSLTGWHHLFLQYLHFF